MQQQGTINREDMLELTRRMTLSRNCFSRVAGAYFDEDGYVDGTFNRHFKRLSAEEQKSNLEIAKTIPFARTNDQLQEYRFEPVDKKPGTVRQMLIALVDCELKNDALLDVFYDVVGEKYHAAGPFAVYLYYGSYDVPLIGTDREWQGESEEVYSFVVCAVCRVNKDYEPGEPESGFLFPAFKNRSSDDERIEIFRAGSNIEGVMGRMQPDR